MKMSGVEKLCLIATLISLCAGVANKIRMGPPPDALPFLTAVRDASAGVLGEVPGMIVKPGHLPRQAFEMLRPNVLEARDYTDLANGSSYSVLLVHCGDITDMGAHYPPQCYPGSGFKVTATRPMPLELNGRVLQGVEYELQPSRVDDRETICIWNCMFLPNGITTYKPSDLRYHTRSGGLRYYGAGQIQVLVRASAPESDRVQMYRQALDQYTPAVEAMMMDPRQSQATNTTSSQPVE